MPVDQDRALIGAIAAHERWARTDVDQRREATRPARDALALHFERQVDPDQVLDPVERATRAKNLRRAHMLRLARISADVRKQHKLDQLRHEDVVVEQEDAVLHQLNTIVDKDESDSGAA